jgi:hypothetical protein
VEPARCLFLYARLWKTRNNSTVPKTTPMEVIEKEVCVVEKMEFPKLPS